MLSFMVSFKRQQQRRHRLNGGTDARKQREPGHQEGRGQEGESLPRGEADGSCGRTLSVHVTKLCTPPPHQVDPSQNAPPKAETEATPVKRRGRPPKSATAAAAAADKDGTPAPAGGGRGRKRAAADSGAAADSANSKMSKQQNDEGSKRQIDLQR